SPFPAFRRFRNDSKLNRLGIQPTSPDDFEADVARDELPAVSWVQVAFGESEHPGFPPAKGEYATDQALRAIWRRPLRPPERVASSSPSTGCPRMRTGSAARSAWASECPASSCPRGLAAD